MKGTCFQLACAGVAALLMAAPPSSAQTAPSLGSAQSFAVLAGSTVTNTGFSTILGNLGVSPGNAVTGFPPGIVAGGTIQAGNAVALAAQNSVTTAYNSLASQPCTQDLTGQDLGGLTLTAGVYCFASSAQLTGTLTLNAQGNANAVFIFKIGSTLTTASAASVVVINGGSLCNIFWQVGSSATLGTGTAFAGNILALTSITLTTKASLTGRALARNGAVTLDSNAVTASCLVALPPPVCPVITLSPPTLPNGTVGVAYSQTIVGSGGAPPYTFSITAGALPAGLTLTPAGVVAGTPITAGTSVVTIRGTDANGCFATLTYTIIIAAAPPPPPVCPPITLAPTTLPSGRIGVAYNETIVASGGTAPYSFGVSGGALPPGLILNSAGVLSGTPIDTGTGTGTTTFTVRVIDANGCFATVSYTIVIEAAAPPPSCPPITLPSVTPPNGTVGVAYRQTITASGGTAPYSFGVTAGALPTGLTLTPAGLLAGTPTTAGTSVFTLRATDANGCFAELSFTIVIAQAPAPPPTCPPITLSPATLPNATVGIPISQTITGSGGTGPYTFGVTSGVLPPGITLTPAGVLSGTPTRAGTSAFTIRGTDANGCFAERSFTVSVTTAVPTLPTVFLLLLAFGIGALGYYRLRRRAGTT